MTATRHKGTQTLDTSIMLQHLHAARLDQERRDREMLNEQLRIARMTQPTTFSRFRTALGDAMISVGLRLTEPAGRSQTSPRPA